MPFPELSIGSPAPEKGARRSGIGINGKDWTKPQRNPEKNAASQLEIV